MLDLDLKTKEAQLSQSLEETVLKEQELKQKKERAKKNPQLHSLRDFEILRKEEVQLSAKKNYLIQVLHTNDLMLTFLNNGDITFARIIIGAGVSGTLVYSEIPPEFRAKQNGRKLPPILVLSNPESPNTWIKEGERLMGQPAKVQTPQLFSAHSEDYVTEEESFVNPYQYVAAKDFNASLIETQNDLDMPILPLKALRIEKKADNASNWIFCDYEYRVVVQVRKGFQTCLYTHAVDICVGLGDANKLTDLQIKSNLAKKLLANNKLVYAQDGEVDLQGNVVLYGGSAINAAWATEILSSRIKTNAKLHGLIARRARDLNAVNTLSRFISETCEKKLNFILGELKEVNELDDGRLALRFSEVAKTEFGYKKLCEDQIIYCEQLVVAIGQTNPQITHDFTHFISCFYQNQYDNTPKIPLGTYSQDGKIIIWGAAGTLGIGLKDGERNQFVKAVEAHANSYPYESQAMGGIFRMAWVIPQMVKQLQEKNLFPKSVNFNSHQWILPDINQATMDDLINIISDADQSLPIDMTSTYAENIIKIRSGVMPNCNLDAPGIQDIEQISCQIPSEAVKNALRQKFFLFSSEPQRKLKVSEMTHQVDGLKPF